MPTLNKEKHIYQPGTLRKVIIKEFTITQIYNEAYIDLANIIVYTLRTCTQSKLENVKLVTPEREETVGNLQAMGYFWYSTISLKTTVTCYSAVNDTMGCLVNCQDYVAFYTDTGEV